jgi:nitroreductase
MFENIKPEHSEAFDIIVRARHSVREFSSALPSQKDVEAIIQAGLLAPFGALAVAGKSNFRKVMIFRKSSAALEEAERIIKSRIAKLADELEKRLGLIPYVQILKRIGQQGVPAVGNALSLLQPSEYVAESDITGYWHSNHQFDDSDG